MHKFANKKVLVTGGTGLIGRQVVDLLEKEGADLTIATLDNLKLHNHAQYFRADLRDMANAWLVVKEKEYVFHLAGVKASPKVTTEQGDLMSQITLAVGESMIKACAEARIPNVLFTSSIGAYAEAELLTEENAYRGKAMDTPGEAKRSVERLIQLYGRRGLAYKVVRLANCFSEDTTVLTPDGIKNIKDFNVGDFIYTLNPLTFEIEVDDVVRTVETNSVQSIIINHDYGVDWDVTPDHNLFVSTNDNKFKFIKAATLTDKGTHQQWNLATHGYFPKGNDSEYINLIDCADDAHLYCVKYSNRSESRKLKFYGLRPHNGKVRYYAAYKNDIKNYDAFLEAFKGQIYIKDHQYKSELVDPQIHLSSFIKLLAWYIAEGNVSETSRNSYSVVINQDAKHDEYREDIKATISACGFKCNMARKSVTFTSRIFANYVNRHVGKYARNKSIPKFIFGLTYSERKSFFDTIMKGDGNKDAHRYTTISTQLAKDIAHLGFLNGEQPLLRFSQDSCDVHRVYFRKINKQRTIKNSHAIKHIWKEPRKYYCLTARKHHVIYAGRNGCMGWIGQCFGPGDNFDIETGMFIPSLMAKVLRGDTPVEVWGDGTQVRDFIYSKDAARGIIHMMLHAQDSLPCNIGSGIGYTVVEVVETLNKIVDFEFRYDKSKPSGVAKRVLDVSKAKALGFEAEYSLADGLKETWGWFKENSNEYLRRKNYFAES